MPTLSFPSNPSPNDTYTFGSKTWTWTGSYWALQSSGAINGIVIGNVTPAAGTFTTLSSTGNTTLGAVAGNLVPAANLTYSLGNATNQWANIYVGGNTIFLGSLQLKDDGGNTLGVYAADGTTPAAVDATAGLAQYVTEAAQGNITSVGTLTSLSVTGNVTAGNLTINTDAVISGNLTVQGTETIFNVNTLTVEDKDIVVANNVTGGANVDGAGLLAGNPTVASFRYHNATTSWQTNIGITPIAANSFDLGTTAYRWGNAWLNTLSVSGNASADNINSNTGTFTTIFGNLATSSQTSITAVGTLNSLDVSGNISAGNVSATNGTFTTVGGTLTTVSQPNITAIGTLSSLTVNGNVSAANVNATLGAFTQVSGNVITAAQPNITSLGTLSSLTVTGNVTAGNLSVSIGTVTTGSIVNANANGVGNIGSSTNYFNTVFAKATSAQYADLAEIYLSDSDYSPGTVVVFGGLQEITQSTSYAQMSIAGVISTNPAHIMNADASGLPVALQGRVPCRVTGMIRKGDLITSSELPGVATRLDPKDWMPGSVIGKALESHDDIGVGVIEVVVGRV